MTNKQYDTIIEMLSQLQSAVIGLTTQVNKLEARVSGLEQKVYSLDRKVSKLEQKVFKLESRMTSLEDRMSNLEDRMSNLEQKLDAHIATNQQQHQEIIDTLNEALNTVSNENDTNHFKFKTRLKNHETRLTGLEKIVLQ